MEARNQNGVYIGPIGTAPVDIGAVVTGEAALL